MDKGLADGHGLLLCFEHLETKVGPNIQEACLIEWWEGLLGADLHEGHFY